VKPHKIVLWFYTLYALLVCAGYILIEYPPISFFTLNIIFIYVSCFIIGSYLGNQSDSAPIALGVKIGLDKVLFVLVLLSAILIAILWAINIAHYGSIEYILLNSFTIRSNTIGLAESIFPVYLTYPSSLVYPAFVIALVLFEQRGQRRYAYVALILFVLIALQDLLTFGRIGILYAIFCLIGYCVVFRKRVFTLRSAVLFALLFFILMLPRLLRGSFDNMSGTMGNYLPHMRFDIHPVFYSFVSVYIYYFSAPFALDAFFSSDIDVYTLGQRTFTPLYNIVSKMLSFERVNTIDPMVNIPFEYNIYTFIKDIYSDFSLFGVVLVPLGIGWLFGKFYRGTTATATCVKIYLLAWIFYTPLFNAYSFGGFLIGFAFLVFLNMIGGSNESINNNRKL
jgi:oligosaccharide repeat unit polymerase